MRWFVRILVVLALAVGFVPGGLATQAAAATPRFTASPSVPMAGEQLTIKGKVKSKVVRQVQLQRRSGSHWVTIAAAKTSKTGSFTLHGKISRTTVIRVMAPSVWIKHKYYARVTFASRTVKTTAAKAAISLPTTAKVGSPISAALTFKPARSGRPVRLQVWQSGAWKTAASGVQSKTGRATLEFSPAASGTFKYRAYAPSWRGAKAVGSPSVSVVQSAVPLAVTTTGLPDVTFNEPYDFTLAAAGGKAPYTWTLDPVVGPDSARTGALAKARLLPGLTLDSDTGQITGKLSVPISITITVLATVTDSLGATASAELNWKTIDTTDPIQITTTSLAEAVYGTPYSAQLSATGGYGSYEWSATGLPTGLSIDSATGEITGTTTVVGDQSVEIMVGTAYSEPVSKTLSLTVQAPATPVITTATLPTARTGVSYSTTLAAIGGSGGNVWGVTGDLPDGLTLDSGTGVISGTPTATGSFGFTISVTDSGSHQATKDLTITVSASATAVGAGMYHTCAVTDKGKVQCWGWNDYGQLGRPAAASAFAPAEVADLPDVVEVAGGASFSCARTAGGTVWCWGTNNVGQLGDGTGIDSTKPVQVFGLTDAKKIVAGLHHACALTTAGAVECWGYNGDGQLGNGGVASPNVPVAVTGLSSGVKDIASTESFACAVTDAGAVKCWGANFWGQLGLGSTTDTGYNTPQQVTGLTSGVTKVAAGWAHACALNEAGAYTCWGHQDGGQFGDGTSGNRFLPGDWSGSGYTDIKAGFYHTCALTGAGAVDCWGSNWRSAVGQSNAQTVYNTPERVTGLNSGATAITTGEDHSCAVVAGAVKCWGDNNRGQVGSGVAIQASPFGVPGLS
jgi:alpha-tubulin suppressor-like RCC1 family protein